MLFANYIQLLHKSIEPATSRSLFTENIIKQTITDERILNYSASSWNHFYDGKTEGKDVNRKIIGDAINNLAQTISPYLNTGKFKQYLVKLEFNSKAKNDLCASFKEAVPDINIDNYADKLSELLENIIKNAADTPKKNSTSDSVPKASNHTIKIRHSIEIEVIIKEIMELIENMPYWYENDNHKDAFIEKYKTLHRLNRELCAYGIMYEFIDGIKKLPQYMLQEEDFFVFNESRPYLYKFKDYKLLLVEIRKELLEYHEE